jgi:hypothetical protein
MCFGFAPVNNTVDRSDCGSVQAPSPLLPSSKRMNDCSRCEVTKISWSKVVSSVDRHCTCDAPHHPESSFKYLLQQSRSSCTPQVDEQHSLLTPRYREKIKYPNAAFMPPSSISWIFQLIPSSRSSAPQSKTL